VKCRTTWLAILAVTCGVALGYFVATGRFSPTQTVLADGKADDKAAPYKLDRTVLPIKEPTPKTITEYEPVHGWTKRQLDGYLARNPGYRPTYEAELAKHR
jgi:hypothetical protein